MNEIQVNKAKKNLKLLLNNKIILDIQIGIGKNHMGTKEKEGDSKTPEGLYKICVKNPDSKYYLSLGLNYPNIEDAKKGLDNHLIDNNQFDKIVQAHQNNTIPPWDTPLGGAIFIHGQLEKKAWSEGCIRLNQHDMAVLYDAAFVGLEVNIFA